MILLTTYKPSEKYLVDELEINFNSIMPKGKFVSVQTDNKCKAILDTMEKYEESIFYLDNYAVIQSEIKMTIMKQKVALYFESGIPSSSAMIFLFSNEAKLFLNTWGGNKDSLKKACDIVPFDLMRVELCCPKITKTCRMPIILFNKDRKYVEPVSQDIPDVIGVSKLRKGANGSITITRRDPIAEAYLDKKLKRLPNQLIWVPK